MEPNPNIQSAIAAPVSQSERIVIIDSLRGIALLGILLMNIPYFSLPDPAADNLSVMRELGTINQKVWYTINFFLMALSVQFFRCCLALALFYLSPDWKSG